MKKQISIAILLATTILFNGCFSTSNMQKAPDKKLWDKSTEYTTCSNTTAHIPLYRALSYISVLIGSFRAIDSFNHIHSLGIPNSQLGMGSALTIYGIYQYINTNQAIKEAQKCSEYKTFILNK